MIRAIVLPTRQMGWPTLGCNQQDLWEASERLVNCKPARMVPKVAGGRAANTAHQNQPFYFIQIAVDGESMRRRFSAPHQFAANAQEQIALRRMCRNEQVYFKGAGPWGDRTDLPSPSSSKRAGSA